MFPLKLVRSLVFGETIHNPHVLTQNHHMHPHLHQHHTNDDEEEEEEEEANDAQAPSHSHHSSRRRRRRSKKNNHKSSNKLSRPRTPALVFLPTKEIITNTYRLATIARDLGMDLYPTPSLSHIIFSNPSSSSSSHSSSNISSFPSTCSFSSSSASWSLLNDAVPVPFPSLATASLSNLRYFVALSKGAFKLVFFNSDPEAAEACDGNDTDWDCCSVSLYSRISGDRIDTMEGFCGTLAGKGWTFFKTKKNPSPENLVPGGTGLGHGHSVYLFRKVDVTRVRVGSATGVRASAGAYRVRELRLPHLDFRNAPLRILQYILLMTDDTFCLA